MKAANFDQSRLLQQTICYNRQHNWSISISWGYSVHIYEKIMPRSWLQLPIETFQPWLANPDPPFYMFNTRLPSNDRCESPHVFFFDSIDKISENLILTTYYLSSSRELPPCVDSSHSADYVSHIHVYSSAKKRIEVSSNLYPIIIDYFKLGTMEFNLLYELLYIIWKWSKFSIIKCVVLSVLRCIPSDLTTLPFQYFGKNYAAW